MSIAAFEFTAPTKVTRLRFAVPMVLVGLLGATAIPRVALAACGIALEASFRIHIQTGRVDVATDFSLGEISDQAKASGQASRTASLGFYIARFQHRVFAIVETGPEATCTRHLRINVDLQLVDRRIQVGRELLQQPCLLQAALGHYEKMSVADETVFAQYVNALAATLNSTPVMDDVVPNDRSLEDTLRLHAEQHAKALVNQTLLPLQEARSVALQAVDTPEERRLLGDACRKGT